MLVAEVAIFAPIPRPLTYQIPDELRHVLKVGALVNVFVGRSKKMGLVLAIQEIEPPTYRVKPILNMLYDVPATDETLIELYRWIESYYGSPFNDILEAAIPQALRKNTTMKLQSLLYAEENEGPDPKKLPKQYEAWCFLREQPGIAKEAFLKKFSRNIFDSLSKKHCLYEIFKRQERQVYEQLLPQITKERFVTLTNEQQEACKRITQGLQENFFRTYLLHGVTGSGKTEVYIEMIRQVIHAGGSVLYLLPEVTLTAQTVKKLRQRLLDIPVHVWHSGLSEGERRDTWFQLLDQPGKLVVGARSAVFLPLANLRLVIVDEEHERAYKQEESPRYHGRDVAVYRAKLAQAICILGSATPSLESYYNASKGKYTLIELPHRVDHRTLPRVTMVDMRYEKGAVLSKLLCDKIQERIERREQVILFLNRRGFAPTVLCPCCDYVATCPHCSLPLTYHKSRQKLLCHLCGYETAPQEKCPKCGATEILYRGLGTQRVEEVVRKFFPENVRLARIDSDILSKKYAFIEVLERFQKQELDLLIGTQMIAKGLDFPNVTLVGLINMDGSLTQQDFRANERAFQLLVQVAGRAGRGHLPGEVIVQTRVPSNETFYWAKKTDYSSFFQQELATRQAFYYPPYRHMIALHISSRNASLVELWAQNFFEKKLQKTHDFPQQTDIRGPIPSPVEKIQDRYRFVFHFLTPQVSRTIQVLKKLLEEDIVPQGITLACDVDAYDFS